MNIFQLLVYWARGLFTKRELGMVTYAVPPRAQARAVEVAPKPSVPPRKPHPIEKSPELMLQEFLQGGSRPYSYESQTYTNSAGVRRAVPYNLMPPPGTSREDMIRFLEGQ